MEVGICLLVLVLALVLLALEAAQNQRMSPPAEDLRAYLFLNPMKAVSAYKQCGTDPIGQDTAACLADIGRVAIALDHEAAHRAAFAT